MLTVGITGGIGSGKSLVSKIFHTLFDIPVFESDIEAKTLMTNNELLKNDISILFGKKSYHESGQLNREYLADLVFKDTKKLEALNSLAHKHVRFSFKEWASKQNSAYIINEAAIMVESGFYKQLDRLVTVTADKEIRIIRVIKRDKLSREQVLQRMEKQIEDDKRNRYADFIIRNNINDSIIDQVLKIHKKLLQDG